MDSYFKLLQWQRFIEHVRLCSSCDRANPISPSEGELLEPPRGKLTSPSPGGHGGRARAVPTRCDFCPNESATRGPASLELGSSELVHSFEGTLWATGSLIPCSWALTEVRSDLPGVSYRRAPHELRRLLQVMATRWGPGRPVGLRVCFPLRVDPRGSGPG